MIRVLKALFLFTIVLSGMLQAQLPTSSLRIIGTNRDSANVITFSVFLKNTNATAFEFNGGQYHFDFNKAILNGGTGSMSILSSGLPAGLQPKNPTVTVSTTPGQLRFAANTPPGAGQGLVIAPGDSVLIMKVKVRTSVAALTADSSMISWRVATSGNPFTKIGAYIASVNTDITSACTFINEGPATPPAVITWQSTLMVSDAGTGTGNVVFGQGTTATAGIDVAYGEAALPAPVTGAFDARFVLPITPVVSSLKDFRNDALRLVMWNVNFQPSASGYPITFKWSPASLPTGYFFLRNALGTININMKTDSMYVLNNNSIADMRIEYNKDFCRPIMVGVDWNIVSVPVNATSMTTAAVLPTATSPVFSYNNGYQSVTTLENGKGYWARFDSVRTFAVCGTAVASSNLPLVAGWNLVGVYALDVPVSALTTTPAGIINSNYFGFQYPSGYSSPTVLLSGKGYWVRATQAGTLNFGATAKDAPAVVQSEIKAEWVKLIISDAAGMNKTLYLSQSEFNTAAFELPPVPPTSIFDVRFANNSSVASLSSLNAVQLQGLTFPVTIKVDGADLNITDNVSGKILNQSLRNGAEFVLTNSALTSFSVKSAVLPTVYALAQNYPNPFNPSTIISYQLPQNSMVTLKVYDVLGKVVATIVNEMQSAGNYTVNFSTDTYSLASGVYVYSIKAGNFVSTKKMVLLR